MCKKRMFAQMCFVGCMVAMVVFSVAQVNAAVVLLSDNFTFDGVDATDVNGNLAARQGGTLATVTLQDVKNGNNRVGDTSYSAFGGDYITGDFLLIGGGDGVVGFNHDFAIEANANNSPVTLGFDLSPNVGGGSWISLNTGPLGSFPDFVQPANELGLAFELSGNVEVRSPGNVSNPKIDIDGAGSSAPGQLDSYVVVLSGQSGTGSAFGANGFQVTAQKNGGSVVSLYSSASGLTVGGFSFNGQWGAVDNLSIDVVPEPGTFALLAAALLGLAAYAWRKRK